ncbi:MULTISPECIES: translation elongation factor 4 [unclassified Oceanispirochaeta]|uniref:translation elongation factor 4 n=1 Tax=unclassified Oceanispirochaeta TaxID=2635722 RepID=UPI000E09505E|nr:MULTISPECIES: translation elongation factor 4 [unclassified Oceanispirochaeta]MBF9018107.1 elongation factor 4 [Oceanispirochaeta sp. M2]NPD74571.1 elongation factor 4 [Oceanispirochaeta sp. M1]RDG29601.1 elongation factor 4 [Oceanispirochaeta sp. M1]
MKYEQDKIRNFCIIAHIDHGKSTLADRFLQKSHSVSERDMHEQMLDSMDIERERGITIKSQAVTIEYKSVDGNTYQLNLVDTPGHVDFSYEVSRAISSCEGALLLVDASQGVEAQTLSNMYMAMDHDLDIVPVVNKMDLLSADLERVSDQIEHDLGLDREMIYPVSAKTGEKVDELIEGLIKWIPAPAGSPDNPLKCLIFDSHYDAYRGVVIHIRLFEGSISVGDEILIMSNNATYKVEEVGTFKLGLYPCKTLKAGQVGYIIAGIKIISDIRVGDTITQNKNPCDEALSGFREVKPVVFSSIYAVDTNQYEELHTAIDKLRLNDASLVYEKDASAALGFGFRCGFLGLLHLEVVQERLEREFGLNIVLTSPSVRYRLTRQDGTVYYLDNPAEFPDPGTIEMSEEPYITADIITPTDYLGSIMTLCMGKRGVQTSMNYLDEKRVEIKFDMPLAEVLFDFYDKLKSISKGYASFDYEVIGFKPTNLVKLDIVINGDKVDALSQLVFKDNAYDRGRIVCKKLKGEITRQQFKIAVQAAIGNTVISRETISALRKDVTSKCYGGDISRKRKLLEKQKEGKKRMKMVGNVELPQSAFLAVLKTSDDD